MSTSRYDTELREHNASALRHATKEGWNSFKDGGECPYRSDLFREAYERGRQGWLCLQDAELVKKRIQHG